MAKESLKRRDDRGRILRDNEYQRQDGRYMYSFIDPATKKRKYIYSWKLERHDKVPAGRKNELSLREKEKEIERDLRDGIAVCGDNMTVLDLANRYESLRRNLRPNTEANHRTVITRLEKDPFGSRRIDTIKTSEAKLWVISLQDSGLSYSSIASIRGLLRPAFQMAVEDDIIRKNVFDFRLCDVIINDSVKRDALTGKQEKTFLEFVKNDEHFSQYYDMMLILFKTGIRVSELCGLTLKDIDLKEKTIDINKQLHYRKDKDGKSTGLTKTISGARVLPMTEDVYEAFKRIVAEKKKSKVDCIVDGYSGFLFMTEKGKPIVGFQVAHRFKYAVQKHNSIYKYQLPKITPHICRHTYCSNLIKKQTSVSTVQYLMGHADCGTTLNCYTHIKMEDARNELEKLEVEEEIRKGRARAGIAEARRELGKAANLD